MARLTYSADSNSNNASGPKALGSMVVDYWKSCVGKTPEEIAALTSELHANISDLFVETKNGNVRIEFVGDTSDVVHVPLPRLAEDAATYESNGFAEAFGNAIVYGCGRSQPIRTVSESGSSAPKLIVHPAGERKAA